MSTTTRAEHAAPARGIMPLLAITLSGALVAVALGAYGATHTPTGRPLALVVGFRSMLTMKVWLATAAAGPALFQVFSAAWMWRRLPGAGDPPAWLGPAHRWSGTAAFLLSLPAAYHCLWSMGFSTFDTRTAVHSVAGCACYGAFTTKMLALRVRRLPGWTLPVAGGLLFAALMTAWATSSLWYFGQSGVPLR
ncbi:DUF6529 family protein [Streptomyces aidingensis]|uniref:Uncharacterized protein n=1 Tax=Streptomyces aidingensis TaxID=910347 RepID=A0A1I1MZ24_9ACTN|nr:DUF6529 family protein [Streptomyces aidingensis]SFC90142.1 hypothetical protein SAMN05421773_107130 [Streptomyces aidingensis]